MISRSVAFFFICLIILFVQKLFSWVRSHSSVVDLDSWANEVLFILLHVDIQFPSTICSPVTTTIFSSKFYLGFLRMRCQITYLKDICICKKLLIGFLWRLSLNCGSMHSDGPRAERSGLMTPSLTQKLSPLKTTCKCRISFLWQSLTGDTN